jgi:hypothetical protein
MECCFTELPIYLTPNEQAEQAVKNRFNKYYSDNRNIILYYDNRVKEYTPIPKKTYDEIYHPYNMPNLSLMPTQ